MPRISHHESSTVVGAAGSEVAVVTVIHGRRRFEIVLAVPKERARNVVRDDTPAAVRHVVVHDVIPCQRTRSLAVIPWSTDSASSLHEKSPQAEENGGRFLQSTRRDV